VAAPTAKDIAELWDVHTSPEAKAARQFRADIFDPTRDWVEPGKGYRLSDRLWQGSQDVRRQIDELLREAIRTGEDALLTAKKLEQFLSPDFSPIRTVKGRLVRNQNRSIVTSSPARGGMGSFPARRLARTEISRVHGAATIYAAEHTPFAKGVKWTLSGRHPKADICNQHAERNSGLGPGVYALKDVPRYPEHPQDLCHLSVVTEENVDAIVKSLREQYGLDNVTGAGLEMQEAANLEPARDAVPTALSVPTFKKPADAQAFFKSIGVDVDEMGGKPEMWHTVARAYAKEVDAGRPIPDKLSFSKKVSKNNVAAHERTKDFRTGVMTDERIMIYTRNEYWKDPAGTAKKMADRGWWASPDDDGIVLHELAHWKHADLLPRDAYGYWTEDGLTDSFSFATDYGRTEKTIARKVSEYGATKPSEFVAETYSGMRSGKTYDDEVMTLYRKYRGPEL